MRPLTLTCLSLGWLVASGLVWAQTDIELEECLGQGKIVGGDEVLVGLTKPLKVKVVCESLEHKAVFKYVSVYKEGVYTLANGSREFNFSDRYHYERAAYLLDRALGLDMVPVAVLRTFQGKDGVLVAWISDAVNGKGLSPGLPGEWLAALERQKSVMRLFDSLIYNVDRRPENWLFNETTGKLYLIDHSQSFRIKPELQMTFVENRIWMSDQIYNRLLALDRETLDPLLKGLVSKGQVKAVLKRRDLIVAKIDKDRQQYGDESVFLPARK